MKKIKCDKIIQKDRIVDGFLFLEDGKIAGVSERDADVPLLADYTGLYLSAGLIDLHTHGCGGYSFQTDSADEVIAACEAHLRHGTTSVLPTVTAAPIGEMESCAAAVSEAKKSGRCKANIVGTHMEGPYLSPKQCGAQYPDYLTLPVLADAERILAQYGDTISRWTYAPELDPDGTFCDLLTRFGVIPSAGHTDAIGSEMDRAMDHGCRLITHLYSCTSTVTRDHGFRRLGVIETAYLRDDMFVEIIADGCHLPPDLIRLIVKIKGIDRVALVTDSMSVTGCDVKEGVIGAVPYLVEDGVCKLRDRSAFCGSIATADRLVRVLVKDCGFGICDAVYMMTETPATILNGNRPISNGLLSEGKNADLIVFDKDIQIKHVYVKGEYV